MTDFDPVRLAKGIALWMLVAGGMGMIFGRLKNRLLQGFLLGTLLGPIGWLIVGIAPVRSGVICHGCGRATPGYFEECLYCRMPLCRGP